MKKLLLLSIAFICATTTVHAQGVGINSTGNPPDPSAILDASSTTKGTLITRMTTAQRDAISNPASGLQIFNTDNNCLQFFVGGSWQNIACGCTSAPGAPLAGSHTITSAQITWNWSGVVGASGYNYNTSNSYATATNAAQNTSYTQSGLTCGTIYTLYVWAYNSCGQSTSLTLTATTTACPWVCGAVLTVTHTAGSVAPVTKTVNYGTVSTNISGATKCWITQNLGADNQAASAIDNTEAAAGWYWQFNKQQGYKHDGAARTPGTAWITSISENSNWTSANDPCTILLGSGWRLPTSAEWATTITGWTNYVSTYASVLKIHAAGYIRDSDGTLNQRGASGLMWSSTQTNNTNGGRIYFDSGSSQNDSGTKPFGHTLRCIKD